jgi:CRISPR/Cas system-associated endonuclease Cas1
MYLIFVYIIPPRLGRQEWAMKKSYYLFNPGRMSRKDNTLKFIPVDEEGNEGTPKYIPVETVESIYVRQS